MQLILKQIVEKVPYYPGKFLRFIPFSVRLGRNYNKFVLQAAAIQKTSPEERLKYTLSRLNEIVSFAQRHIPFYQRLYGNTPIIIKYLRDFEGLPVITKKEVRAYTKESAGATLINTGGTSGEPLSFYIDSGAWAREWAHMHYIWGLRGYRPTDLMITMLGKDLGKDLYRYNPVHNEIKINPYRFTKRSSKDIISLFEKYPIKYFQGYPSSIYHFFRELEQSLDYAEKQFISSKIRSLFFSSEYPLPYMIEYLKETWNLDYISWYGHSEMCVLAYDQDNSYCYRPFATYGYAEDVGGMLHGTSFHNFDMPLIRYATGDLIEAEKDSAGLINHFRIKEGREGDFVEDKLGAKISLTALVFGRHHKIFNYADFVQISQNHTGSVTFYVTFLEVPKIQPNDMKNYFDLEGLCIDADFIYIRNPILTKNGKLKLRVESLKE